MSTVNAVRVNKTVADPIAEYDSLMPLWKRSRAICNGERFTKEYDGIIDRNTFSNLLIPFSPMMDQKQYNFYKAEAELPGIVAQFSKMIIGALLRKQPILELPDNFDETVANWILNEFGQDDSTLTSFLDSAIWEELQTSRAWVYVDYPRIENPELLTNEDFRAIKPYPVLWKAESVINWTVNTDNYGKTVLTRVIVRDYIKVYDENEFHPTFHDVVKVHDLDEQGYYRIRTYKKVSKTDTAVVVNGFQQAPKADSAKFELIDEITNILANGNRLTIIPAWPLNGCIDPVEPILSPLIDKEIALYNKMSRRNHLLYGAATYTPYVASDMSDTDFQEIVDAGLGTWIRLKQEDTIGVLDTPTAALTDMDRAISSSIEEMAKMGIRMLTPETDQSGVALQIRNAAQTAQLGTLNTKISNTMRQIITFMISWRLNIPLNPSDIKFQLSTDFNPLAVGEGWLRLATEWYQQGLIPRSAWLVLLKQNDAIPPDYDDVAGREEITRDQEMVMQMQNDAYAEQLALEAKMKGDTGGKKT